METEEIKVKLKLFEAYLMPAILHGVAAWGKYFDDSNNTKQST